jgi:hypothetical protein
MIGPYQAWFKTDPTAGLVVKFTTEGEEEIFFQPMALNWYNDLSQIEQIAMPSAVTGTPSNDQFTYDDAYGTGIDLIYTAQETQLKEELAINQWTDLPTPPQFIIDGGNPVLQLNFLFETNNKIYIDGAEWDKKTATVTSNAVDILNANDEVIYSLAKPVAVDALGNEVVGTYEFKKTGNSFYISIHISRAWLSTATYPVMIDPTFTVDYDPIPAELLTEGLVEWTSEDNFTITDVTTNVSDNKDNTFVTLQDSFFHLERAELWQNGVNHSANIYLDDEVYTAELDADGKLHNNRQHRNSQLRNRRYDRTSQNNRLQRHIHIH